MENRQQILGKMLGAIKGQAMQLKEDTSIKDRDKLEQANILLDIMGYVRNFNEYSQVIAEHNRKKQRLMGR